MTRPLVSVTKGADMDALDVLPYTNAIIRGGDRIKTIQLCGNSHILEDDQIVRRLIDDKLPNLTDEFRAIAKVAW